MKHGVGVYGPRAAFYQYDREQVVKPKPPGQVHFEEDVVPDLELPPFLKIADSNRLLHFTCFNFSLAELTISFRARNLSQFVLHFCETSFCTHSCNDIHWEFYVSY